MFVLKSVSFRSCLTTNIFLWEDFSATLSSRFHFLRNLFLPIFVSPYLGFVYSLSLRSLSPFLCLASHFLLMLWNSRLPWKPQLAAQVTKVRKNTLFQIGGSSSKEEESAVKVTEYDNMIHSSSFSSSLREKERKREREREREEEGDLCPTEAKTQKLSVPPNCIAGFPDQMYHNALELQLLTKHHTVCTLWNKILLPYGQGLITLTTPHKLTNLLICFSELGHKDSHIRTFNLLAFNS